MELIALATDAAAAAALHGQVGGRLALAHESEKDNRPYSAMLRTSTERIDAVAAVADFGLYVAHPRVIKAPTGDASSERVIASFGLVAHPELGHTGADDHWRDTHGPLALRCHEAMCDYTQLSIVHTIDGRPLDGIALCAFDTRQDLSERFFNDDEARQAIIADVSTFADARNSPARVVLTEQGA